LLNDLFNILNNLDLREKKLKNEPEAFKCRSICIEKKTTRLEG
jgi:hypothetical protein